MNDALNCQWVSVHGFGRGLKENSPHLDLTNRLSGCSACSPTGELKKNFPSLLIPQGLADVERQQRSLALRNQDGSGKWPQSFAPLQACEYRPGRSETH